jgi:hypothetical protein
MDMTTLDIVELIGLVEAFKFAAVVAFMGALFGLFSWLDR